jgi:glycerol-3-phosphate dehydrogenase
MVQRLSDIVFRRTELGTGGYAGEAALEEVATFMQKTLGWSDARVAEERREVDAQFERFLTAVEPTRQATPARVADRETEAALLTNAV